MIEVEPSIWLVLLGVAWAICGVLKLLEELDTEMPERQELVEAFFMIAWILLLLHIMTLLYLRSCVHYLLSAAAFSDDKRILNSNLKVIAEEEAKSWQNDEVEKALGIMRDVQDQHEESDYKRSQTRDRQNTGFQFIANLFGDTNEVNPYGVVAGSPRIDIRFFSPNVWHVVVMLLMILNGFIITLFIQCVVYDLDEIFKEFGSLPAILVPLPLALNTCVFQRHIFYDFVIVSNTRRIDSHTLSDVVENFSEVVRLRSEFATTLLHHITQQELVISDLQAELKTRDRTNSGSIDVDDLREVLSKFGFRLTRFRFNSVVKLLFELEGTMVAYAQVVRLVLTAQSTGNESVNHQQLHPLLMPHQSGYQGSL